MIDWKHAHYELRVDRDADQYGYYAAYIYVDGVELECRAREDRDAAIAAAREWVAWRRATGGGVEIIPL